MSDVGFTAFKGGNVSDDGFSKIENRVSSFRREFDLCSMIHAGGGAGFSSGGSCRTAGTFEAHALSNSKIITKGSVFSESSIAGIGLFPIKIGELFLQFLVPRVSCIDLFLVINGSCEGFGQGCVFLAQPLSPGNVRPSSEPGTEADQ